MRIPRWTAAVPILLCALVDAGAAPQAPPAVWAMCARNAEQANEALTRCNRLVHAWYKHKGRDNFLLPQNLRSRVWNGHNSAADRWSFFVLTAHLTDQKVLGTLVRQTLRDDILLATRVRRLTDDYHIDRNAFVRKEPSVSHLIMTNSEYVKDGLLPIIELTGETVWFDRCRDLLDDIFAIAPVETRFGKIPSESAELNGEMLQSLCRFYGATRDPKYKEWAFRIGDAYFLDALPKCNGLPCHHWDFARGKPRSDVLSLSDHGNEIVFGLSEVMVLAHVYDKGRAPKYIAAMKRLVDTLLEVAVNEDGLWYHSIRPSTLKVPRRNTPDTWGYALDGVYALYMVTGETKYRDAVHRALRGINAKKSYRNWGGSDAFADSVESGIVLLNRIPEPQGFEWLEATVKPFLAKQRVDGIIEGWHGDGNYARTALMYALMKTAGTRVVPWRPDLKFGAVVQDGTLYLQLTADKPWKGTVYFDYPRHKRHFGLTLNYPRLNEYPEWYPIESNRGYQVTANGKALRPLPGGALIRGLPISVNGAPARIAVGPVDAKPDVEIPDHAKAAAKLQPPGVYAQPQATKLRIQGAVDGERLRLHLTLGKLWEGKLFFDYPRGRMHLGQRGARPEEAKAGHWYAVKPTRIYEVKVNGKALEPMLGDDLLIGLPLKLGKGKTVMQVEPLPGPPYGGKALRIEAPHVMGGDGPFKLPVTLFNDTGKPLTVRLSSTFGTMVPAEVKLAADAKGKAQLTGTITKSQEATITATAAGLRPTTLTVRLVRDKNLVGLVSFDAQEYKGTRYLWCGQEPFQFTLPAKKGKPHTLHLLWGSKGGKRGGILTLNGKPRTVTHGGYDGFQWLKIPIEAEMVKGDTLTIRVAADPANPRAAFISEARLTSP